MSAREKQPMSDPSEEWDVRYGHILRTIALVVSVIAAILACGTFILLLVHTGFDFWQDVIKEHFPATIGLAGVVAVSFGIVTFLRQSEGPIEFEVIGMKLKGAAGQVILWAFCVIVLSVCAKLLW